MLVGKTRRKKLRELYKLICSNLHISRRAMQVAREVGQQTEYSRRVSCGLLLLLLEVLAVNTAVTMRAYCETPGDTGVRNGNAGEGDDCSACRMSLLEERASNWFFSPRSIYLGHR